MQSAETGQRGYLLTGRDVYLAPYRTAVEQLPPMLDRSQDLISDNPVQSQSLGELRSLSPPSSTNCARRIDAYKAGQKDTALLSSPTTTASG